jgi:hypothetical protein
LRTQKRTYPELADRRQKQNAAINFPTVPITPKEAKVATYSIQVLNNSNFAKSYVLFMQPPKVTSSGGQPEVYTNAWVTFPGIQPNGTDHIIYTDQTFAYWATATIPVAPGTKMNQDGSAAVDASQQDSVNFIGAIPTGFGTVTHGGAETGSYRIIASSDFDSTNGYLFGLARPGNVPDIPSPVATFIAQPNDTYDITPVINFYVADGDYTPGSIIDYSAVSTKAGNVSFTGKSQTNAVVTQGANGLFTTKYY